MPKDTFFGLVVFFSISQQDSSSIYFFFMTPYRALRYRLHAFVPHLVDVQKHKFIEFLNEGIIRSLKTINPIHAPMPHKNVRIVFYPELMRVLKPKLSAREALHQKIPYEATIYVPVRIFKGQSSLGKPQWVLLGNIPFMTNAGHFLINGSSRVMVNQMVRRPGLYFKEIREDSGFSEKRVIFVDFLCRRGAWVRIQCDKKERFWLCLKNAPKVNLDLFIAGLAIVEDRLAHKRKATPQEVRIINMITERLNLHYLNPIPDKRKTAYEFLYNRFKNPKVYTLGLAARQQINRKLGLREQSLQLTVNDLRQTKRYLMELVQGSRIIDDIDNLANRRVRPVGDLMEMQFDLALSRLEKNIKQRLDRAKRMLPAHTLLDAKQINKTFREFFGPTNPLAQYLEQLNPLAEVTHKRRINATGPGGVSRDNANLDMRNIHPTHYGRICPIETPEGKNAGLVNTLTTYGRVTTDGYIETPYYRVVGGQIQKRLGPLYFTTPQEQTHGIRIAPPDLVQDPSNVLPHILLPARMASEAQEDFLRLDREEIDYTPMAPSQLISIATALIPFLEHNDANRALMGSNMQRQTVPLMRAERPIVSTGLEGLVVGESGHILQANRAGIVSYVNGMHIHVQTRVQNNILVQECAPVYVKEVRKTCFPGFRSVQSLPRKVLEAKGREGRKKPDPLSWPTIDRNQSGPSKDCYTLQAYERSNQETALVQRPSVSEGDWVQKGDLLADCAASVQGGLALGHNLMIAYVPWEGYNFEDAVVISERLVFDELYTTLHIERYETEVRDTPGSFSEIITKQLLPNFWKPEMNKREKDFNSELDNALDANGIIRIGRWVTAGDILVGKIAPLSRQERILGPYERLAYDVLGLEIPTAKNVSFRVPKGIQGRIVNKQIAKITPVKPYMLNDLRRIIAHIGKPPPGRVLPKIPKRLILKVRLFIAEKRSIQIGDKVAGRHGNKGIISCVLPRQDMPYLPDGTAVDMVLNPLGVPSRMNVGQVFECLLGLAGSYLGQEFRITPFDELFGAEASRSLVYLKLYQARLKTQQKWLFQPNFPGKMRVFDGRTGETFDQFVTAGKAYMLKLVHLVDEKIHARATGTYALITQQPVGGRAKHGGQRLGEMEVWALEAFGAAYTLQELLTTKSDDLEERETLMSSIIAPPLEKNFIKMDLTGGEKVTLKTVITAPRPPLTENLNLTRKYNLGTSEAFRLLLLELQSLCLDVGIYALTAPDDIIGPVSRQPIDLCTVQAPLDDPPEETAPKRKTRGIHRRNGRDKYTTQEQENWRVSQVVNQVFKK
jgi:DNA-directed RNA polymerase subunit beta